jgi:hypothetical protein
MSNIIVDMSIYAQKLEQTDHFMIISTVTECVAFWGANMLATLHTLGGQPPSARFWRYFASE